METVWRCTKMNNKQSKRNFQVHRTVRSIVVDWKSFILYFFFYFFSSSSLLFQSTAIPLAITRRNASIFFSFLFILLSCIVYLLLTAYYFMMTMEHFKIEHGSPTSISSNRNDLSKQNEKEKSFFSDHRKSVEFTSTWRD